MARPEPSLKPRRPRPAAKLSTGQAVAHELASADFGFVQRKWFDVLRTSKPFDPDVWVQDVKDSDRSRLTSPSIIPLAVITTALRSGYERLVDEIENPEDDRFRAPKGGGARDLTPFVKRQRGFAKLAIATLDQLEGDFLNLEDRILGKAVEKASRRRPVKNTPAREPQRDDYEPIEVLRLVTRIFAAFAPLLAHPKRNIIGFAMEAQARRSALGAASKPVGDVPQLREWLRERRAEEPDEIPWHRATFVALHRMNVSPSDPRLRTILKRLTKLDREL